jgi:hypothetical protein
LASLARSGRTGDFNYDTIVNLADFTLLAGIFGLSAGADGVVIPQDWANLAAAVLSRPRAGYCSAQGALCSAERGVGAQRSLTLWTARARDIMMKLRPSVTAPIRRRIVVE